jgi:tetraacyldisaccharide 4'-kinase
VASERAEPAVLTTLYASFVNARRRWYRDHPAARRTLSRPVISVGNLAVGGSGKTPLVAWLARLLLERGERPAILSRGHGRRGTRHDVVVVRDPDRVRADLWRSGDEPLMLARDLPGTAVVVARERYLAGLLAERHLGATVHLLDDGFQHLALARDVDLLLLSPSDLECRLLPFGPLREPLAASAQADALIIPARSGEEFQRTAARLDHPSIYRGRRTLGEARLVEPWGEIVRPDRYRVLAVAGIARPQRFFADLREAGWTVAAELTYRDHYRYGPRDVENLARRARFGHADLVITTEKDLVRLLPFRPMPFRLAWLPLNLTVEPVASFERWLAERMGASRAAP